MGLLRRVLTSALDALVPPADPAAGPPSPVVPPDSPALQLLLRQVELDGARAARDYGALMSGRAGVGQPLLANAERARRRAVADKVRRGRPVTQREVIEATTGLANTMGAAGDALRLALAFDPRPSPAPAEPPLPAPPPTHHPVSSVSGPEICDRAAADAELASWLGVPPSTLLADLLAQPALADRWFRTDVAYEVVAICWARTAVGEGAVSRAALPAALDAWLRADRLARRPDSPAPADVRARAWDVDLLTAGCPRAAPHAGAA